VGTGLFLAAGRGGLRRSLARAGSGADIPLAARSGAFAPAHEEHKPEARAKINTDLTRTRRHSPAYGGIRSTMAASENLAFSPAEMRVSWADYSFPGWRARDDRPSEKRKVDSSILSLTTTDRHGYQPASPAFRLFRRRFHLHFSRSAGMCRGMPSCPWDVCGGRPGRRTCGIFVGHAKGLRRLR
jgi:hypothetical protein